jgi:hypothetical protein
MRCDVIIRRTLISHSPLLHFPKQGKDYYLVRVKMAQLNKQWKVAEAILLQNGNIDEAIAMYRQLHKWQEALVRFGLSRLFRCTCFHDCTHTCAVPGLCLRCAVLLCGCVVCYAALRPAVTGHRTWPNRAITRR